MKITVAEARLLKNAVSKRLHELLSERNKNAFVEFEKDEEYIKPDKSFEELTKDIEKVRSHYMAVKKALAESNLKNTIEWNGKELTIVEALELVKELRDESDRLISFGNNPIIQRSSRGIYDSKTIYRKALFEPSELKKAGEKMRKEANRLSILIDKANFNTSVELEFADEYQ